MIGGLVSSLDPMITMSGIRLLVISITLTYYISKGEVRQPTSMAGFP